MEFKELIEFAPHVTLSPEDQMRVCNWKSMQQQVAAREAEGFNTSKILVTGASFVGQEEKRRPLLVQARVFYSTPEAGETSYHTNFIPDGAALLLIFRVAEKEATQHGKPPSLDQHYVFMVEQSRYGMNDRKSLELPGGLAEGKNPALAALQEFAEEGVAQKNEGLIPTAALEKRESLGPAVMFHPALVDQQFQFAVTIDMSPAQFVAIKNSFHGSRAGNKNEQESTRVAIVPLREAYLSAVEHGGFPLVALSRYMMKSGLLSLAQ